MILKMGFNIQVGDKLYAVSTIDCTDFEISEWIVEDSYDIAGISMYRCRKYRETDEYIYFWETLVEWVMHGGNDAEYTAFKSEDRDMLYNFLINRGEFIEKPKLEREIDILTKKMSKLNQNIDEAKKMRRIIRENTSGANISS